MDEPHSTEDAADHQVQSLRGYELEPGGGKARKKSLCRGNSEGIRQIYGKKFKVCPKCPQCPFSKCYSVSWKNGMKGFIFSLPPCECILSGERRPGVTAWPLIWQASARGKSPNDARCRLVPCTYWNVAQGERRDAGTRRRFESCRSNSPLTGDHPPYTSSKTSCRNAGRFVV